MYLAKSIEICKGHDYNNKMCGEFMFRKKVHDIIFSVNEKYIYVTVRNGMYVVDISLGVENAGLNGPKLVTSTFWEYGESPAFESLPFGTDPNDFDKFRKESFKMAHGLDDSLMIATSKTIQIYDMKKPL